MLLLSIDTSGKQGSIGLSLAGERPDDSFHVEMIEIAPLAGGTFSAELVPQIATLLSVNGFTVHGVGALAVVSGPGSFTGLRIGLAAVKAFAEVLQKPIAAVSLLEACAFSSGAQGRVLAVLDAGRGDVYVGEYEVSADRLQPIYEHMVSRSEFVAEAKVGVLVTPDAALVAAISEAGLPISILPPVTAAEIARVGWRKLQRGETVTPDQLEANYIRRTDAEMLEKSRS